MTGFAIVAISAVIFMMPISDLRGFELIKNSESKIQKYNRTKKVVAVIGGILGIALWISEIL